MLISKFLISLSVEAHNLRFVQTEKNLSNLSNPPFSKPFRLKLIILRFVQTEKNLSNHFEPFEPPFFETLSVEAHNLRFVQTEKNLSNPFRPFSFSIFILPENFC